MPGSRSLIGRDPELAALVAAVHRDHATVLVGEAGIGKTALVRASIASAGRTMHEGGALATLRDQPYLALRRAVAAGVSGDPASVAAAIEHRIGPDVLFLDDAQWADDLTLAAIELLIGRILVVAAIRSLDPGADRARNVLERAGAQVLTIEPLPASDSRALVAQRRPGLPEHLVEDIVRRAAGNPLLLEEMADHGEAPTVLARVLTSRLDQLPASARAAVELLAVADRPLPRAALGRALDAALRVGIAVASDTGVEVRHQLVADAVRAGLDQATRRRRHARVATILGDGAEAARHLAGAGKTAEAAAAALRALESTNDPRERAALLVIAAEASDQATGIGLRLQAARALDEVSDWVAVVRVLGGASAGAGAEEEAEANALLAHAAFSLGDVESARRYVEGMDVPIIPPACAAAVRCAIEAATFMVNVDGAVEPAIARLDAVPDAADASDPAAVDVAILRASILLLASGRGDPDRIRVAADEAFDAGRYRTATDRARVIQYLLNMGVGSEAALAFLLERHARYVKAGLGSMASEFLADAVVAAVLSGKFEDAIGIADGLLEEPAPIRPRQSAEIHRARAMVHLGRLDEAEQALEALRPAVSADYFGLGETLLGLAEAALYGGRPAAALELGRAALAVPAPLPLTRVQPMVTVAWAHWELGLEPEALPDGIFSPSLAGAPLEIAGLALSTAGDHSAAAASFDEAALAWRRFNAPRMLASQWAAGESRRRAGSLATAVDGLQSTLAAAKAIGFEPLAARARRSLRLAGVRVAPSAAAPSRAAGLTARERELVALVERGLTNLEIARRLGLGRPTVARILGSAMLKLGVSSRAQLAASVES